MYVRRLVLNTKSYSHCRRLVENRDMQNGFRHNSFLCSYVYKSYIKEWDKCQVVHKSIRRCYQGKQISLQEAEFNQEEEKEKFVTKPCVNFENTESKWYHHKILLLPGYSNIVVESPYEKDISEEKAEQLLQSNWKIMSMEELLSNFEIVTIYVHKCYRNKKEVNYESVLKEIADRLFLSSNSDLESILRQYQLIKMFNNKPENIAFIKALDKDIQNRLLNYSLDERLKICDLLQTAHLSKFAFSFYKLMKMLSRKINRMSQQQLIHYTYLLSANKHCVQAMYELEYYLSNHLHNMSISEIGVTALCFFKRKYQPRNSEFLSKILQYSHDHVNELDSYYVTSIMKFFRSFRKKAEVDKFKNLLQALHNKLDTYQISSLAHIAHAAANNGIYNESLIQKIVDRFMNNLRACRVKDLERIAFALSTFNFNPEHTIFQKIIEQLNDFSNRNVELNTFTKAIPITCMFLGQAGYYNMSVLEKIMDPNFYNHIYKTMLYNMNLEYLWLDQSIEIEIPNFRGNRLEKNVIKKMSKFFKDSLPSLQDKRLSEYNSILVNLSHEYQKLFGEKGVTIANILPHFIKSDLVIAVQNTGKILPVQDLISDSESIKYIPKEFSTDINWFALIIGNKFSYLHESNEPTGFMASKMRQLKRIGYTPIMINYKNLEKINTGKGKYLESLLFDENKRTKFNDKIFIN